MPHAPHAGGECPAALRIGTLGNWMGVSWHWNWDGRTRLVLMGRVIWSCGQSGRRLQQSSVGSFLWCSQRRRAGMADGVELAFGSWPWNKKTKENSLCIRVDSIDGCWNRDAVEVVSERWSPACLFLRPSDLAVGDPEMSLFSESQENPLRQKKKKKRVVRKGGRGGYFRCGYDSRFLISLPVVESSRFSALPGSRLSGGGFSAPGEWGRLGLVYPRSYARCGGG